MILRWFLSRTVRQAVQMRRHVRKILNHQRDILSSQAIQAVEAAIDSLKKTVEAGVEKKAIIDQMTELEKVANKWLKPYPSPALRENIEVMLVAIAVAMGIRTFFLQPFKIPTGSMQPTLYGIWSENLKGVQDAQIPNRLARFWRYWAYGEKYIHVVAETSGEFRQAEAPKRFILFNIRQRFQVGDTWYTLWFPPDQLFEPQYRRAGVEPGQHFEKGEDIIKARIESGDHLFVDRMTYNFRRPKRGEIIVFKTQGIRDWRVPQDQFYIKRLVALGGETVKIGPDNHLIIKSPEIDSMKDGQRLTAATPHFEFLYGFDGNGDNSDYCGHVATERLADGKELTVGPRHYVVMGDNTRNSLDSRYWGDFPQENVIGKSSFVYWPFNKRFGLGYR
jgi:signal peptidase I